MRRKTVLRIVRVIITIIVFNLIISSNQINENENAEKFKTQVIMSCDSIVDSNGYISENRLAHELFIRGIKGDNLERMIYIAKRESNLYSRSYNSTLNKDKSHDAGLFQINSYAWKDLWRKYNLLDPMQNIEATVYIYNLYGFSPWYTIKERNHVQQGIYTKWQDYVIDKSKLDHNLHKKYLIYKIN